MYKDVYLAMLSVISIMDVLLNLRLPSFNTTAYNFWYVLLCSMESVIMNWLCTIETCIQTFQMCLAVAPVYILSSSCPLFSTVVDHCGRKQIN